jgi:hypothetical protein
MQEAFGRGMDGSYQLQKALINRSVDWTIHILVGKEPSVEWLRDRTSLVACIQLSKTSPKEQLNMTTHINRVAEAGISQNAYRRILWVTPIAILVSAVANMGFYAAAGSLFAAVTNWPGASMGQIIGANIVYLLIAAVVFAVVVRTSSRPGRNYLIIATLGLALSMFMPISVGMGYGPPEIPTPSEVTVVTLCLMHVLSYVISVPMFIRLALD